MPVNPVPEDQLRTALRPYRVDPGTFEAAVRRRLRAAERERERDPLAGLSPLLRGAAAFLPLQVLTGCRMSGTAAGAVPAAWGSRLLGYLAFPAISLFLLLGATVFSVAKVRSLRQGKGPASGDERAIREAVERWWSRHNWGAWLVFAGTLILSWVGATWLLFLFYIISFGLLLYVLTSLARLGLGNREVIGGSCATGLVLLGQLAAFPGIGGNDIHFVDQSLVGAVFFGGALLLTLGLVGHRSPMVGRQGAGVRRRTRALVLFPLVAVPLIAWWMNPILRPATPARIKRYVESFDRAPYSSSSWHRWEIVASWAVESKLDPDLSRPRRLLAEEISDERNRVLPFILGSAFRVGLVRADQIDQLKDYRKQRRSLLDDPGGVLETRPIGSVAQEDWVIRAAVLRNDLSPGERDSLEKRLHATLEDLPGGPYAVLETALRVTRLLEAIGRPVDRDRYRARVHDWLRTFHSRSGGGFQMAGGFKVYPTVSTGSLDATSYAIELMEIYGIPDGLDLNWVRSFLKPLSFRPLDDRWIAAASLDRLDRLPGVARPTWLEVVYYERSLIAAMVLVGLCLHATLSSPGPGGTGGGNGSPEDADRP